MKPSVYCLLVLFAFSTAPASAQTTGLLDALKEGSPVVNLRLRQEVVGDDRFDDNAAATTLRTALGYRSGSFRGLSFFGEAEAVSSILHDDTYNNAGAGSLGNGEAQYPVIADPVFTEINQAYMRYANGGTSLTIGRQELVMNDSRFVGNVGWRQNHQSFDGAFLSTNALEPVTLNYAFLRKAHRITGADHTMRSHVADASAALAEFGTLTVHAQLLDFPDVPGLSTSTFGGRFAGAYSLSESATALYEVGFASQSDAGDNPNDISATYMHAGVGASFSGLTLRAGREALSGSAEDGTFVTTLATLHKFNGWADQFLGTPPNGLVDLYATASTKLSGASVSATYHMFSADTGDDHYGDELDILVTYAVPQGPQLGAKVAHFMGDTMDRTVTKVWLWAGLSL